MSLADDHAGLPAPPSEKGAWMLAGAVAAVGLAVLLAVLTGLIGSSEEIAPPPVPVIQATPAPAAATGPGATLAVADPTTGRRSGDARRREAIRLGAAPGVPVARSWLEGFYPIYATAQSTFGVNWLLIASIHMQETAFSTAPSTYHGLNFAHCCGGPMQFNVRNGRVTTWDLVSDSYRYGARPAGYDHMTAGHPSIYDDFDAIMAAAHLLSADGAGYALDGTAWSAAYDYYGHDATGVLYADEVLGRAIAWSQHGFCANCGVPPAMAAAVDAAYGAPVRASLLASPVVPAAPRASMAARRRAP